MAKFYFDLKKFPGISINGLPDDFELVKEENITSIHWGELTTDNGERKYIHNLYILPEMVHYYRLNRTDGKPMKNQRKTYKPLPEFKPQPVPGTSVRVTMMLTK
ncbi:hypothetical protein [Shimazuella alba]|uniref:Uncharacterized protein n=1 Tax=Shimazuella alba TaxID=2690964 RepID=A0A6I4W182_9BACL|nr:hypothetical protein [Shimazuella alba]MXQ54002.1 hypothetical protein [Shimazuella alba]